MNTRAIIAVIAFAIVAGAFGQEYSTDAVVPETEVEPASVDGTFDDSAVYSEDKLPYQTGEIDQEHTEEVPVYTSKYVPEDQVRYEPTYVTKQVPTEIYYTKPIEEKTTEDWTNETEKVLMPYWKKVAMNVKVSIPIDVVRYKAERKQVEGDDNVLKKVYVPAKPAATGSAHASVVPMIEELEQTTTNMAFPTLPVGPTGKMWKPTMKEPLVPVGYGEPMYQPESPEYSYTPPAITATPASTSVEASYDADDLPYETRTIHQEHTVQTPVESTHYVTQDVYRYEPETVTKQVPTEVYYTKPVTEKTTTTFHNESFKELVPYWKKVTMTVNVTIPISVVRYKAVVKTVEGNETVLKKVFVPRSAVTSHSNTTTNKTNATVAVAPMEELGVGGNDTITEYKTLPGPIAGRKTVDMPQKVTVQRPVVVREVVPQTQVTYKPTTVTDDVKVPLPSWEQDSKEYRNVTSWEPEEHTIHIVKPMEITFMTQDLKWKEVPEKVEVETVTRGTDTDDKGPDKYLTFGDGNDETWTKDGAPEVEELQYANITYYKTEDGPIAYKEVVDQPQRVVVQKPVVYRTMVPQEQVHYQTKKVTTHIKVPLPSWEQSTKSFHNETKWVPVPKTLHIVKPVPIEFMTQELKWTTITEPVEHVTVTRGDDEDTDNANRYVDYSAGEDAEVVDYHDDLVEVEAEEED